MVPNVAIVNASTVVTNDQVREAIRALEMQVALDFSKFWPVSATMELWPKEERLKLSQWEIIILDDPDQADALGYHELNSNGLPLSKVFAKLDLQVGASWTVTLSHELLEMLVDPWINLCAQGPDGFIYALEVCDPVESDSLGYTHTGVLVSDFVTPAWFGAAPYHERVDYKSHLGQSLELAPDGFISIYLNGRWEQMAKDKNLAPKAPVGSRRHRRNVPQREWRRSVR